MQMNQAFINQYTAVFANGNGTLEYVAEVLLGSDNEWHFLLWDVANNKYDDLTDSNPGQMSNFNGGQGWTLFETHYAQGSCSNVPSTSMSGLRYYVNGSWQYATANRPIYNGSDNPSDGQSTSCFDNSDDSGSTFYGIDFMQSPDYGWTSETYAGQTYS